MVSDMMSLVAGKLEHIADVALRAGVAYTGYRATGHWTGGLSGLVALELAKSPNLAAGLAGTGMLAWLGLSAFVTPAGDVSPPEPPEPGTIVPPQFGTLPVLPTITNMTIQECLNAGGTVVQVYPMTDRCACQLPPPESVAPPEPEPRPPPGSILR